MTDLFDLCVLGCSKLKNVFECVIENCKQNNYLRGSTRKLDVISDIESIVNTINSKIDNAQSDITNIKTTVYGIEDNVVNRVTTVSNQVTDTITQTISDLNKYTQQGFLYAGEELVYIEGLVLNATTTLYDQIVSTENTLISYVDGEFNNITSSVIQDFETDKNQVLLILNYGLYGLAGVFAALFTLFFILFIIWCAVCNKCKLCACCTNKKAKSS